MSLANLVNIRHPGLLHSKNVLWPYSRILTVSKDNSHAMFRYIQAAIDFKETKALADVVILPDGGVYNEALVISQNDLCIASLGVNGEVVITSDQSMTVDVNANNIAFRNLMLDNAFNNGGAGTGYCAQIKANRDGTIFDNVRFNMSNGSMDEARAVHIVGDSDELGTLFRECYFSVAVGVSKNYGISLANASILVRIEDTTITALGGTSADIKSGGSGNIVIVKDLEVAGGGYNFSSGGVLQSDNAIKGTVVGPYTLGGYLNGKNWIESIIKTTANDSTTITVSGSNRILRNWLIQNSGSGTTTKCLVNGQLQFIADGCFFHGSGNPTNGVGFHSTGGDSYLKGCKFDVAGSSTNRAILADTADSNVVVEGGYIANGDVVSNHAGAVIELRGPQFGPTIAITQTLGVIRGHYYDNNGKLVVVGTTDILGKASNAPDLGSTTAAEKWGTIYMAHAKDIFPAGDDFGFWSRYVNYGRTPDEHWRGGADEISWTGWASYTGFATPGSVAYPTSRLQVQHTAATRAFRYRSFINAQTAIEARCMPDISSETGIMVDDGVNNADGVGANNFYRVFLERASSTSNVNFCIEHRAGGAAVTKVTAYTFPAGTFRGMRLLYGVGTRWTNWQCFAYIITENGQSNAAHILSSLTWTPARHGLFHRQTIANVFSAWDWFDEA